MNPSFSTDADLLKRIGILRMGDEADVGALVSTLLDTTGCKKRPAPHHHRLCEEAGRLIDDFFLPYLAIRNRKAGYAVSIVIADTRLIGRSAGPVRPLLADLAGEGWEQLDALIKPLGSW